MYSKIDYQNLLVSDTKTVNFIAIIRLLRPKQWIKNCFVFLGLLFSNNAIEVFQIISSLIAFVLFCFISSSVYIFNDLIDINSDKIHPDKRLRPLPAGQVTKVQALFLLIFLFSISMFLAFLFNTYFAIIILIYFAINILYTIKLKKIVILDIMVISFGFLLRVISGYIVIHEEISSWSLIVTLFLTMFLGLNKRKQEILTLDNKAKHHRKILNEYSIELINQILPIVAACAIIAYSLYTFQGAKSIWMMITIPMVLYGMLRYQYLDYKSNVGENPEKVLSKDIPFIINSVIFVGISLLVKNF